MNCEEQFSFAKCLAVINKNDKGSKSEKSEGDRNWLIFLGSHYGNSQLFNLFPPKKGSDVWNANMLVLLLICSLFSFRSFAQIFPFQSPFFIYNMAPIVEGLSFDMTGTGQSHLALCTGAYNDGVLRVCVLGYFLDSYLDDGPVILGSPVLFSVKVRITLLPKFERQI